MRDAPCVVAVAPLWYAGWAAPLRDFKSPADMLVVEAPEQRPLERFLRISTLETLADRPVSPLLVVPRGASEPPVRIAALPAR